MTKKHTPRFSFSVVGQVGTDGVLEGDNEKLSILEVSHGRGENGSYSRQPKAQTSNSRSWCVLRVELNNRSLRIPYSLAETAADRGHVGSSQDVR